MKLYCKNQSCLTGVKSYQKVLKRVCDQSVQFDNVKTGLADANDVGVIIDKRIKVHMAAS